MLKTCIPALLLSGVFLSCDEPQDGGPCTYDTDTINAPIVRVDSNGSDYPELYVAVPLKPDGTDTMRYYSLTNESPSWADCEAKGLKTGTMLKVQRMYIQSGHCTPELFRVVR